jgi:hypothetical protein
MTTSFWFHNQQVENGRSMKTSILCKSSWTSYSLICINHWTGTLIHYTIIVLLFILYQICIYLSIYLLLVVEPDPKKWLNTNKIDRYYITEIVLKVA